MNTKKPTQSTHKIITVKGLRFYLPRKRQIINLFLPPILRA
jgi:hypothetical protein